MEEEDGMTLDELETWKEAGPKSLDDIPIPENAKVRYEFNDDINSKISIWPGGDSTRLSADAIVNAANEMLRPGGGICGAIHRAAGRNLFIECKSKLKEYDGYVKPGNAVLTKGYNLPAKYVIHTVGPRGNKPKVLKRAYNSTLNLIDGEQIRSVGLCGISTGIFGFPLIPATRIALKTVREWLENEENREKTDRIVFVVFLPKDVKVYFNLLHEYFPLTKQPVYEGGSEEEEDEEEEEEEEEDKSEKSDSDEKKPKKVEKVKDDEKSDSDEKKPKKVEKVKDDRKRDSDEKKIEKKKDEKKGEEKDGKPKRPRIPKVKVTPVDNDN